MEKRNIIIILFIILIIVIVFCVATINKENVISNTENVSIKFEEYENNDNHYVLYDDITNDIIAENIVEEQLKIYIDNPEYNPSPSY